MRSRTRHRNGQFTWINVFSGGGEYLFTGHLVDEAGIATIIIQAQIISLDVEQRARHTVV